MQTYKKVLLLLLIACFTGLNHSCSKKVLPTTYPNKPGLFPITITQREYRLKRHKPNDKSTLSKIERKQNRLAEREKRKSLKAQEKGRKEHIKKQKPEVQERMKKSYEESERIRGHKSFWERVMFWKKDRNKEKRIQ